MLTRQVIQGHRAQEVLEELEEDSNRTRGVAKGHRRKKEVVPQLSLFGQKPPLLEEVEKLEIDLLTPLEALTKLYELQKKGEGGVGMLVLAQSKRGCISSTIRFAASSGGGSIGCSSIP